MTSRNRGVVSVFILSLLTVFLSVGLSMVDMRQASMSDSLNITRSGVARFLAQSALQDGKYYTMKVDSGFTGTSQEQSVSTGYITVGSYDYTTTKLGNSYTISATGYVPNKSAVKKVSHTVTSTFAYSSTPVGILVLDSTASGSLAMSGNGSVEIVGGKIVVNSSHAKALTGSGNAKLTAPDVDIVGNYRLSGNAKISGDVDTGQSPGADPYAMVPEPDPSSLSTQANALTSISGNTTKTLDPGVYKGGIELSGNSIVTLNSGIYYLQGGGLSISGNAKVAGTDVMIFNETSKSSDDINLSGNGVITLTSPSSGDYKGIVFFQKRASAVAATVTGNGNTDITGAFYFAGANMTLTGNGSGAAIGTVHVVKSLTLTGNGNLTINTSSP